MAARGSLFMDEPITAAQLEERKYINHLAKSKLFQGMDLAVLNQIAKIVTNVCVPEGAVLFRQGDPPGSCYVLLDGEVGIFIKTAEEMETFDSRQGTPRDKFGNVKERIALERNEEGDDEKDCSRHSTAPTSPSSSSADCGDSVRGRNTIMNTIIESEEHKRYAALAEAAATADRTGRRLSSIVAGPSRRDSSGQDSQCDFVQATSDEQVDERRVADRRASVEATRRASTSRRNNIQAARLRRSVVFETQDSDSDFGADSDDETSPAHKAYRNSRSKPRARSTIMAMEPMQMMRIPTVEGFSKYHEDSWLGLMVASKTEGMIGELALMEAQPRSASLQCLQDCEFLSISRKDFDMVLKKELNRRKDEKVKFLKEHIPGLRRIPRPRRGRPDSTYFFRQAQHMKGHKFLTQAVTAEDMFCVIISGEVEVLRHRPQALRSNDGGVVGTMGRRASSPAVQRRGQRAQTAILTQDISLAADAHGTSRLAVLVEGGLFGSLNIPGEVEPFTVRVLSPSCEVFIVDHTDMIKLPRSLMREVNQYLHMATTWRLKTFCEKIDRTYKEPQAPAAPPEICLLSSEAKVGKLLKAPTRYEKSQPDFRSSQTSGFCSPVRVSRTNSVPASPKSQGCGSPARLFRTSFPTAVPAASDFKRSTSRSNSLSLSPQGPVRIKTQAVAAAVSTAAMPFSRIRYLPERDGIATYSSPGGAADAESRPSSAGSSVHPTLRLHRRGSGGSLRPPDLVYPTLLGHRSRGSIKVLKSA